MPPFKPLAVTLFVTTFALTVHATPMSLPRSTPESQGVSSSVLLSAVEALDAIDAMNSFMLVRHGKVVAEGWWSPYGPENRHELYSLSKSFTSTAVGMAIAEGKVSVDDEVLKFFPEDAPASPSANLKAMRIRDLLSMSTGHQDEPSSASTNVCPKTFYAQPVPHKPGTHFKYNTAATFMLSAIVQKQTGQTVLDYLQPRLFHPLGIDHPTWDTNFQGVSLGGYGLKVRTEDIAKFGQLYLQQGKWEERQLVPASWVASATSKQTSNGSSPTSDWDQGYGYQFWRCRHGAYRGDGAFGQYCLVLPEQDAVIAITSGVKDMQAVLNIIWDKLLPAFQYHRPSPDSASQAKLTAKLTHLSVRTAEGAAGSSIEASIIGKRFKFTENDQKIEWLQITQTQGGHWTLATKANGVESTVDCQFGSWTKGNAPFATYTHAPLAASAAWASNDTLIVKTCAFETPFYSILKLHFDGNQVTREWETNVGFGRTKPGPLIGQAQ
ncbi:MAG TPA: serine hydrolase [Candidatus Limnocylindria bacterium]|nr:serine hydrolase [Candidatus Limnocylindria bacterium]